ncbi:hypothetical protein BJV82DRAFT_668188 [Fennellomyces sp. T-0311]|nr:hypothetical protein BJV82DRAFT_668188 [Fennellomyces sp. T-0311]
MPPKRSKSGSPSLNLADEEDTSSSSVTTEIHEVRHKPSPSVTLFELGMKLEKSRRSCEEYVTRLEEHQKYLQDFANHISSLEKELIQSIQQCEAWVEILASTHKVTDKHISDQQKVIESLQTQVLKSKELTTICEKSQEADLEFSDMLQKLELFEQGKQVSEEYVAKEETTGKEEATDKKQATSEENTEEKEVIEDEEEVKKNHYDEKEEAEAKKGEEFKEEAKTNEEFSMGEEGFKEEQVNKKEEELEMIKQEKHSSKQRASIPLIDDKKLYVYRPTIPMLVGGAWTLLTTFFVYRYSIRRTPWPWKSTSLQDDRTARFELSPLGQTRKLPTLLFALMKTLEKPDGDMLLEEIAHFSTLKQPSISSITANNFVSLDESSNPNALQSKNSS